MSLSKSLQVPVAVTWVGWWKEHLHRLSLCSHMFARMLFVYKCLPVTKRVSVVDVFSGVTTIIGQHRHWVSVHLNIWRAAGGHEMRFELL